MSWYCSSTTLRTEYLRKTIIISECCGGGSHGSSLCGGFEFECRGGHRRKEKLKCKILRFVEIQISFIAGKEM